jgi:hypothetical protein
MALCVHYAFSKIFLDYGTNHFNFSDFSSFYMKVSQIEGVRSNVECGSYVLKTYDLTEPGSRANAFR